MITIKQIVIFSTLAVVSFAMDCPAGNHMTRDDECIPCPIGTYQGDDNKYGCRPCPAGTIAGTEGSTECTACPKNTIPSRFKHRCICADGTERRRGECKKCKPGTKFVSEFYRGCEQCSEGYYQPRSGQSECLKCPDGSVSGYGAKECFTCDENQTLNAANTKCVTCKPGFAPNKYGPGCSKCASNTYKDGEGNGPCIPCPVGTHSDRGATECTTCPDGTVLLKDMTCGKCDAGSYFNTRRRECMTCGFNQFNPRNSVRTSCYSCSGRKFSLKGATGCTTCPRMKYLFRDGTCQECPLGSIFQRYNLRCQKCQVNQFSRGDMEYCETCPNQTYALRGATTCFTCPKNEALLVNSKKCGSCKAGRYYDQYQAKCLKCYEGSINPEAGIVTNCKSCSNGMTSNADRTECIPAA